MKQTLTQRPTEPLLLIQGISFGGSMLRRQRLTAVNLALKHASKGTDASDCEIYGREPCEARIHSRFHPNANLRVRSLIAGAQQGARTGLNA